MAQKIKDYFFQLKVKFRSYFGKHTDPLSLHLKKISKKKFDEIGTAIEHFEKTHFKRTLEHILNGQERIALNGLQAENILNSSINNLISEEIKQKLGNQDVYYWLSLDRRISGDFYISSRFNKPDSVALAKKYLNNVIRIYSKQKIEQITLSQNANYPFENVLFAIELQVIASLLQKIAIAKRICAKGGILFCDSRRFDTYTGENMDQALRYLDHYNGRFSKHINKFGFSDLEPIPVQHGDEDIKKLSITGMAPAVNFRGYVDMGVGITSHPMGFDCSDFLIFNNRFELLFKANMGISYSEWLKCLSVFTLAFVDGSAGNINHKFFVTGYSIIPLDSIIEILKNMQVSKETVMKFILLSSYKDTIEKHDHILTLDHEYFLYDLDGTSLVLDGHLVGGYIVNTISKIISSNSGDTFKRGRKFELQINSRIKLLGIKQPFPPGFEFFLNKEALTECDDSIEINDVLLLLDCKSIVSDHALDLGSFENTQYRVKELRKKLKRKDEKAIKLMSNSSGDNYNISHSKVLVQLITASNEWLPPNDPIFWWAKGVPRICRIEVFEELVLPYLKDRLPNLDENSRTVFFM